MKSLFTAVNIVFLTSMISIIISAGYDVIVSPKNTLILSPFTGIMLIVFTTSFSLGSYLAKKEDDRIAEINREIDLIGNN